jgi:hypothetical protein
MNGSSPIWYKKFLSPSNLGRKIEEVMGFKKKLLKRSFHIRQYAQGGNPGGLLMAYCINGTQLLARLPASKLRN